VFLVGFKMADLHIGRSKVDIKPSEKVCRRLLSVDHGNVKDSLKNEYEKNIAEKSKLWNFDFENNTPLNDENGFQWEECTLEHCVKPRGRLLATSEDCDERLLATSEDCNVITMDKPIILITPPSANEPVTETLKKT
jgi:hypothetical protein